MSKWTFAGCVSVAVGALMLGGCAAGVESDSDEAVTAEAPRSEPAGGFGSADLIPVNQALCNGFWVKNQGNIGAPASTLRVKYSWLIAPGLYDVEIQYF